MFNLFKGGMKGRLFLTIRRRGGNNPARLREGGSKMRKGIVPIVALLGALVLVGFGCGNGYAVSNNNGSDTNAVSETTPEVTNEAVSEVPAGFKVYNDVHYGFSFQYPESWVIKTYDDDPQRIGIIASDNPAAPGNEPLPEISVVLRNNPDRLAIRDFYDQAQEPIFDDAAGGVNPVEIAGDQGFSLHSVSGEVTTDLVVLTHGTYIVEFELTRNVYREVFDALVNSFRFSGGM